jgi:hypothetical protein
MIHLSFFFQGDDRSVLGFAMWLTWMCCVTGQFLSTAASLLCEIVAPFNFLSQFWSCFVVIDGGLGAGVGAGIGCAALVLLWWCLMGFAISQGLYPLHVLF